VVKEAKRKSSTNVLSAKNKNKALWNLIDKESAKTHQICKSLINAREEIITNPQIVSERFNIFRKVVEDLLSQSKYHCLKQNLISRYKTVLKPCLELQLQKLRWNSQKRFKDKFSRWI
jgi:hypothetical protein